MLPIALVIIAVFALLPAAAAADGLPARSQILALYDQWFALAPTPVVALNRAIAVGEIEGPAAALERGE